MEEGILGTQFLDGRWGTLFLGGEVLGTRFLLKMLFDKTYALKASIYHQFRIKSAARYTKLMIGSQSKSPYSIFIMWVEWVPSDTNYCVLGSLAGVHCLVCPYFL